MSLRVLAVLVSLPLAVLLLGAASDFESRSTDVVALDATKLPANAQALLPMVDRERQAACPELPLIWLAAEVQAESGWNPRAYSPAGAAGLLQFMPGTWASASGGTGWDPVAGPPADHPVWDPQQHMHVALPWMCANLRLVTAHIHSTGKPTDPLVALAICHIAGCSRVTGSATGVPAPGEAGCGAGCVEQISAYVAAIQHWVQVFAAPAPAQTGPVGAALPGPGGSAGCSVPDPTGTGGCVTAATSWLLGQVASAFPATPVSCYRRATWGEHPLGRACDFVMGRIGTFPGPALVQRGWQLATWAQANASVLHVQYVIWQGRIWSVARAAEGWRVYDGAGVYDTSEPTGGHYDHVHISVTT